MQAPELLQELVVVFGVAVMVVLALSRLRLPTIAGLIAAGALIGPSGLGWVPDSWRLEALAEIGVGLLLFGSELDPHRVSAARRLSPDVPILVKVPRLRVIGDLHERGASDIVAGEFETALEAVTRVLHAGGVAEEAMGELLAALRHEGVPEHGPVSGPRRMLGTMGACGAARRRRARTCTSCGPTCRRGARAARSEHWGWCYIDALEIDPLLPSPPLETRRRPSSPVPPRPAG